MSFDRRAFLKQAGLGLSVATLAGCGGSTGGQPPAPHPVDPVTPVVPSTGGRGMALALGLNFVDPNWYQGWDGELFACEYDANDMTTIARANGFETRTLLTADATRDVVLDEIRRAAETLNPGDIFMLSYSGHGGQMDDLTGPADEDDGLDETWCLYDGELLDDELYAQWALFKPGVRVLVFSDSCRSGTATKVRFYETIQKEAATAAAAAELDVEQAAPADRDGSGPGGGGTTDGEDDVLIAPDEAAPGEEEGADPAGPGEADAPARPPLAGRRAPRFRVMPAGVREKISGDPRLSNFYRRIHADVPPESRSQIGATVLLISGCQDNQLSADGSRNGRFTGRLKSAYGPMNAPPAFTGDYRRFHGRIVSTMPPTQSPNYFVIGAPNPAFEQQRIFTI